MSGAEIQVSMIEYTCVRRRAVAITYGSVQPLQASEDVTRCATIR